MLQPPIHTVQPDKITLPSQTTPTSLLLDLLLRPRPVSTDQKEKMRRNFMKGSDKQSNVPKTYPGNSYIK